MQSTQLPDWFAFGRKSTLAETDFSKIKKLIIDRILLLGINGQKDFKRERDEEVGEYQDKINKEVDSFHLMKLGVCLDPRLSAWFIQSEGDLFEYRFSKLHWEEIQTILDFLFNEEGNPVWMEKVDLAIHLGEDIVNKFALTERTTKRKITTDGSPYVVRKADVNAKIIGIDFRYANFIVKQRRALLYKGWVIGSVDKLMSTIKHRYEALLNEELTEQSKKLSIRAQTQEGQWLHEISELISSSIKPKREYSLGGVVIKGDFDDHIKYYPPCIQQLVNQVEQTGYIPHWERFQLGIFLKQTGMDVDTQLKYWFSKAVDNVGMSYNDFVKRAGYIIRHIYGLEGGKIDYTMPSCNTIQSKMYCYFRHKEQSMIEEELDEILGKDSSDLRKNRSKEIQIALSRGMPSIACSKYLEFMLDQEIKNLNQISHPMIYLKIAAKSADIFEKSDADGDEIAENEAISDEINNNESN